MGHPENDLSRITVPTEDEAIPRAFAQLEENISAWSGAISEAHGKLLEMVEQARRQQSEADQATAAAKVAQETVESQAAARSAESQASAKAASESKPVQPVPAGQSSPVIARPVEAKVPDKKVAPSKASSTAKAPPKYTREMAQSDTDESTKKRGKSMGGLFVRKKATDDDAESTANIKSSAKSKADDPDEALLATLDEKTAQAIRIKRRLLNKSVRELLDEMK